MSDSLRDQLLQAGFTQPKAKPAQRKRSGKKPKPSPRADAVDASASAPVQTQPKAGYTHVPATPPKKKKAKKAPAVKARAGSWSTREHVATTPAKPAADPVAAEKRRQMKADVQALIDEAALKNFKGEEIYRFTLQNKIRELLVSEPVRKQLANGELAITRLNGVTRLIPAATVSRIRNINPQWVIFITTDADDSSDEDEEFPIPDDLIW